MLNSLSRLSHNETKVILYKQQSEIFFVPYSNAMDQILAHILIQLVIIIYYWKEMTNDTVATSSIGLIHTKKHGYSMHLAL